MAKLFDYNNPIWRFMGKLTDVCFLTVLWALFSLPIVTIGASTTALYYVSLKLAKDQEGYIWRTFVGAFKENFKQSTIIWLIMLALGIFLGVDLYFYYNIEGSTAVFIFWIFVMLTLFYLFFITMLFPLSARLDAKPGKLFFLTFMVTIKHFSWALLMVVTTICVIALGLFVFWPILLISMGGIAFIHSKILIHMVFPKYGWNEE